MRCAHSGMTVEGLHSLQCLHTPVISITGLFGEKPALFAAALRLSATAVEGASPTAPVVDTFSSGLLLDLRWRAGLRANSPYVIPAERSESRDP